MVPINSMFTGKVPKLLSMWTSNTSKRYKQNRINDDHYNSEKIYFQTLMKKSV